MRCQENASFLHTLKPLNETSTSNRSSIWEKAIANGYKQKAHRAEDNKRDNK